MAMRAHRFVAEELLARIVGGEFSPGDLLPKEVALAEEYDVNRGTVREALRALEERHVVLVRHGRGATVQESSSWNVLDPVVAAALLGARGRNRFLAEIEDARAVVEGELAARAAEHATEADHAALDAAVDDDSFETTLARIARNRPLATVAAALRELAPPSDPPDGAREEVAAAVASGDADAAWTAMHRVVGSRGRD
jgi:DNA-binding FadR family transcriptional regulator